jgi:hypothetical protein
MGTAPRLRAMSWGSSHDWPISENSRTRSPRAVDVRSVVELGLMPSEDARTECLMRLGRIAKLGARRRTAGTVAHEFREEGRGLALRRAHVDAIVARRAAAGRSQAPALARLRAASDVSVRARTRLVESHLRLVTAIARRHTGRGLDLPDLAQEGTIGLMRAIERFDPRRERSQPTPADPPDDQSRLANRARLVRLPGASRPPPSPQDPTI